MLGHGHGPVGGNQRGENLNPNLSKRDIPVRKHKKKQDLGRKLFGFSFFMKSKLKCAARDAPKGFQSLSGRRSRFLQQCFDMKLWAM